MAKFLQCARFFSPDAKKKKKWNLVDRVFENELLRNKILKFALYDADGINMKTASACKLVNSTWLEDVNVILNRKDQPPVKLNAGTDPHKIQKYVYAFEGCPAEKILPYHLTIAPTKLYNDHHWETVYAATVLMSGLKCLFRCGHGLVDLTINCQRAKWNMIADSLQSSSGTLSLPYLQRVKIELGQSRRLHRRKKYLVEPTDAKDWNINETYMLVGSAVKEKKSVRKWEATSPNGRMHDLVKKIFAASGNVKKFSLIEFHNNIYASGDIWGIDTKDLTLPKSLQEIQIVSCNLQSILRLDYLFTRFNLSNLTSLTLEMNLWDTQCTLKVLRILYAVNRQLQKLDISNAEVKASFDVYIHLPAMVNLKELRCGLWMSDGDHDGWPVLKTLYPALEKFVCFETSRITLLKWVGVTDKAVSVVEVHVEFSDPFWPEFNIVEEFFMLQKMRRLRSVFTNLTRLSLVFPDFDHQMYGMKYIFHQLTKLRSLQVHLKERDIRSDKWNALLLGISVEEARTLQKTLCRGDINFQIMSSVVNLQELNAFCLSTSDDHVVDDIQPKCYLGITVKYGISRMPNLVDFSCSDAFSMEVDCK